MKRDKKLRDRHLPKNEADICSRLRQARIFSKLTREQVAELTGINAKRIANYEYNRAPIKCDIALRLCQYLLINEKWLATGEGPFQPCIDLRNEAISEKIKYGELFSVAFETVLAPVYEHLAKIPVRNWIERLLSCGPFDSTRLSMIFDWVLTLLITNLCFDPDWSKTADQYEKRQEILKSMNLSPHLYLHLTKAGIDFVEKEKGPLKFIDITTLQLYLSQKHLLRIENEKAPLSVLNSQNTKSE